MNNKTPRNYKTSSTAYEKDEKELKFDKKMPLYSVSDNLYLYNLPPLSPSTNWCLNPDNTKKMDEIKETKERDIVEPETSVDISYMKFYTTTNKKMEEIDAKLKEVKNELEEYKKNNVCNSVCNSVSNNISYYIKYLYRLKDSLTQEHTKFAINTSLGFFVGMGMSLFWK